MTLICLTLDGAAHLRLDEFRPLEDKLDDKLSELGYLHAEVEYSPETHAYEITGIQLIRDDDLDTLTDYLTTQFTTDTGVETDADWIFFEEHPA